MTDEHTDAEEYFETAKKSMQAHLGMPKEFEILERVIKRTEEHIAFHESERNILVQLKIIAKGRKNAINGESESRDKVDDMEIDREKHHYDSDITFYHTGGTLQ